MTGNGLKHWTLHLALILVLFTAQLWLSPYHATNLARIMVLAVFAMGYNLAFGYTGLLSLGHALLLAAGMYAAGLPAHLWGIGAGPAFIVRQHAAAALSGHTSGRHHEPRTSHASLADPCSLFARGHVLRMCSSL